VNAIAETDRPNRSLAVIVEDDKPFLERWPRAMETRGFSVTSGESCRRASRISGKAAPAFAWWICGSATAMASTWSRAEAAAAGCARHRAHRLWKYRDAVTAVKMGAVDYPQKPADADDVVAALLPAHREVGTGR